MAPAEGEEKVLTNDILAMLSPEGERVSISLKNSRKMPVKMLIPMIIINKIIHQKVCCKRPVKGG